MKARWKRVATASLQKCCIMNKNLDTTISKISIVQAHRKTIQSSVGVSFLKHIQSHQESGQ